MHWFQRIWNRLFRRSSTLSCSVYRLGGDPIPAGGGAMAVATVYRCVRLLSETVASLPLSYMRLRGGLFAADVNSSLHRLLTVQPNPSMSAFDFWAQAVSDILVTGNAYIVPLYNGMDIDSLVLCSRGSVSMDEVNGIYYVSDTMNGLNGAYGEADIIHLKNLTSDGTRGLSTLTAARRCIDIAGVGDAETLARFSSGGNVRGLVANQGGVFGAGEYADTELAKTAASLDSRFRGGERILSLPGQVDFKQISLSSTDLQFLESRKFAVRDICRFFGVHPSFVFDDTSNNYKSAEMANAAFLCSTLNPLLLRIENELLRKLVPQSLWGKRRFEFDRRAMFAGDLTSLVTYQQATIAAGLYTVNEWRLVMNRPPVEGGDTVLISANLRPVEEVVQSTVSEEGGMNDE